MGQKEKANAVLTAAVFCVLSFPVLSYGLDLPFLTEAKRDQQIEQTEQNRQQQRGLLSELLPSSRLNPVSKGQSADIRRASPPKHIVKLLEKMSRDQDLRRGNTVRSFVPVRRHSCGKEAFVFSLRTMKDTELLNSVELHYFVRNPKKWADDNLRLNVQFHQINNDSICHTLRSVQLPPGVRGWQTLNMTSHVERMLNSTSPKIEVGVVFTVTTDQSHPPGARSSDGALVRKILSKHVKPFMLVYTEDQTATDEASHLSWQRIATDLPDRSKDNGQRRQARSVSNIVTNNNSHSLMTNEFPEDYDITNIADATFPYFAEQNSRRRKARKKEKEKERKRKHNKNKKGKNSKKQPLLDQSGESEESEKNRNENKIQPSNVGLCSRQPMRVNFDVIGWDEYVIAPRGYDAFYCAGQCPFPLAKNMNPSNHAAIQSVVSALGAIPDVPAPCCVPEKMSPISILFFDEDENVALKSYPDMQVDACSCR